MPSRVQSWRSLKLLHAQQLGQLLPPGLRPPSKDFDYNQPLIRKGPNDYLLLQRAEEACALPARRKARLTKLGKRNAGAG